MFRIEFPLPPVSGYFLFFLLFLASCQITSNQESDKNQLADARSPYLQQHANNPVHWHPWGEEALQKAQRENKPLIISIGYAACHWCHVMEHETFENDSIAAFMNEHFVSIKVDREERPDIDQIYMDAVQLMTGSGGWPLNAIALPTGEPFFTGTYFTPEQWMKLLQQVEKMYDSDYERIVETANKVTEGITASNALEVSNDDSTAVNSETLRLFVDGMLANVDTVHGGFTSDQKFPLPVAWDFLLTAGTLLEDESIKGALNQTLSQMTSGGMYDQIGGGFSRYTVDTEWKVPHFEKMLYDNGQLVSLYANAYRWTGNEEYLKVVNSTLQFVERELNSPEVPAFYSSIDADSEGEEGLFYLWTMDSLDHYFSSAEVQWLQQHFALEPDGNWEEGKNILWRGAEPKRMAESSPLSPTEMADTLSVLKDHLMDIRATRERPRTDDKILAAWNALMSQGYIDAYKATLNPDYLKQAKANADFVWEKMKHPDGGLYRSYEEDNSKISGFLDDYAYWIQTYLSLYQVTFDEEYLDRAGEWTRYVLTHFSDDESPLLYYTSAKDEALIARKVEITDNVQPASNSVMAHNLFVLGHLTGEKSWLDRSREMLQVVLSDAARIGQYYAHWYSLYAWMAEGHFEVAIVGPQAEEKLKEWHQYYYPNVLLLGGDEESDLPLLRDKWQEGYTIIYVCKEKVCRLPVESVPEAVEELESEW